MTIWIILTRAVHFGACLLFFGVFIFDRFTARGLANEETEIGRRWKTRLRVFSRILPAVILVSGVAWFALVAVTMSGQPLTIEILKVVWAQTQFGAVSKIRLCFLGAAAVLSCFQKSALQAHQFARWVQTLAAGCLLASLAWAGHGQEGARWHLIADVAHLLAAGIWPAGLFPLLLLLRTARTIAEPHDWRSIAILVSRFSAISLVTVLVLALTGTANALFLVGNLSNLVGQPYGRWLLAKIIFFCLAVAIAGINLFRLTPRLMVEHPNAERALATTAQLQTNVQFELILGSGIVVVVAVLGILPPAMH